MRVGVKYDTALKIIQTFKREGRATTNIHLRGNRKRKINEQLGIILTSPKLLDEWASYSLKQRVIKIKETYGVQIAPNTLGCFYRSNGLRFAGARTSFSIADSDETLQASRVEFI